MGGREQVGRNDPCPCGSGRKYKRCCLTQMESTDHAWHRLRRAEGEMGPALLRFAVERYGRDVVDAAWADFAFADDMVEAPVDAPEFETAFLTWFLFTWIPRAEEWSVLPADAPRRPIALEFLAAPDAPLDAFDQRFVRDVVAQPHRFYAVTAVVPDRTLSLRDVFTHQEVTVRERQATRTLTPGAIVYTRVIAADGVAIMVGCAPLVIPPRFHAHLLDVRDELAQRAGPVGEEFLHEHADRLRAAYLDIADELHNPRLPELRNTDGDPLVLTKLYFTLHCTPREAFDALMPLALGSSDEELLDEDAAFDADGALCRAHIPWLRAGNAMHTSWENTTLGHLRINGACLVAEVNSERRVREIRVEIERRLGGHAVFSRAKIENVERLLAERRERGETPADRRRREESERLRALPEVQEHVRTMMAAHWETWFDTPIPALRGQTPREAARTPAGCERLESLLQDYGWRATEQDDPLLAPDVDALRRALGL